MNLNLLHRERLAAIVIERTISEPNKIRQENAVCNWNAFDGEQNEPAMWMWNVWCVWSHIHVRTIFNVEIER